MYFVDHCCIKELFRSFSWLSFQYREALNAPGCDAIHITEIETSFECDTFIPAIDSLVFQPWYSSFPLVENNIRYSFMTYVRVRSSADESQIQNNGDSGLESIKFEVKKFSFLPKMIFERHEEYMYLRLVEDIISNGVQRDDRTGTGTLSKFGCQVLLISDNWESWSCSSSECMFPLYGFIFNYWPV